MFKQLNVIALVSGGKDSIYSMLHCLQNGHKVVAMGNLYPEPAYPAVSQDARSNGNEHDLNSFMYQTVGHTVIPLYAGALGMPLYRQPILGRAVQTGTTYQVSTNGVDETESLVPLLKKIMAAHPEANAVSTGAILSTYQRTRVESVALRLGLEPLSFLWQYPGLPPGTQISLLQDMVNAGLDARIIKVASGGLDESFLWLNLASERGMRSVEKAMARFGMDGDGAVLGEGGEFETLVLDGPDQLFKGRIVVDEEDLEVVREGGGAAWLRIKKARVEMKGENGREDGKSVRAPDMLEARFSGTKWPFQDGQSSPNPSLLQQLKIHDSGKVLELFSQKTKLSSSTSEKSQRWLLVSRKVASDTIEQELEDIIEQMEVSFREQSVSVSNVVSTLIILRSMKDFLSINKIYGAFFNKPNPASRVTIACGDVLPPDMNILIQLTVSRNPETNHLRRALHVQSRSYWAPENIGPYSQAQSIPLSSPFDSGSDARIFLVLIAGQIPLVPGTMALPERRTVSFSDRTAGLDLDTEHFKLQILLSLQHLFRIGRATDIIWWTGTVAFLSRDSLIHISHKARLAGAAWAHQHLHPSHNSKSRAGSENDSEDEAEQEQERDLWEERHHFGLQTRSGVHTTKELPDWSTVKIQDIWNNGGRSIPPFFAAEVQSLPRDASIEWAVFSGVTGGPISISSTFSQEGKTYTCQIDNLLEFRTVMVSWPDNGWNDDCGVFDLAMTVESLLEKSEGENGDNKGFKQKKNQEGKYKSGYCGAEAAWLDASVKCLWDAQGDDEPMDWTGVVPCWSLWDGEGKRLGAVLVFRHDLTGDEDIT